jgi:asparagine synthase (glutamine-hydrolysing)
MSAQAGIWNFDGKPVGESFLDKLSSAIEQYGPDGGNTYINGSIGMTYRAFHTTPESRLERQPYTSPQGNVITWDGRLDNRDELIPQLWDELTADRTDVGLVAAAFELWGTDCFRRMIGDWAFSVWRPLERELLLACDYMSVKHIFYYPKKSRIWWSTDLTSLILLSGDKFHINDDYIAGYFANDPDAHLTPYCEIREVPPGHFVRIRSDGSISVHRHWSFSPKSRIRYKTDADYEEHFRHIFQQSVRRRLRTDSPILADLSGGLDSSSVVCMADDILANQGAQPPRLDTLSYCDQTEPQGDDWVYRQKVEERRGRVGYHVDASKVGSYPAPLAYPEFIPLPGYLGFGRELEAARAEIVRHGNYRVALSGIGGDEFMGGIPDPRPQLADLILQFKFVRLAKELMAWSMVKRKPWIQILLWSSTELLPLMVRQYLARDATTESWIDKGFARNTRLAIRQLDVREHFGLWLPTRRSLLAGVLLMSNRISKGAAPNLSIGEARYPYLDQTLIEFVLSIPANQLLRPGDRRSLMRRSLVGCVPPDILARRTKQVSVRTPVLALEKNWKEIETVLNSPLISRFGYIQDRTFSKALENLRNGKRVHLIRVQRTISLEFWLRDLLTRDLINAVTVSPLSRVAEPVHMSA